MTSPKASLPMPPDRASRYEKCSVGTATPGSSSGRGPQVVVSSTPPIAAARQALVAFELDPTARGAKILKGGIAYLRPGPFLALENEETLYDNRAFVTFVDAAFERFLAQKCPALIIDLRSNPGGDHSFSDRMLAWFATEPFAFAKVFRVRSSPQAAASNEARLRAHPELIGGPASALSARYTVTPSGQTFEIPIPETHPRAGPKFEGPVYVIVDRYSYSNAVNVAAIVQDYGFGTVVGEKTADLASTYGAMESFTLPRTKIEVFFPKAHIIRPNGDTKSDGVTPDVIIERPLFAHPNVVLDKVVELVRSRLEGVGLTGPQ